MEANKIRFVSPVETALYLKTLEPLRKLSNEDLAVVAQRVKERFFRKGEKICRRGEGLGSAHIVMEGRVRATGGEHGDDVVGSGGGLGILSLLARDPDGIDAVAEADTTTLEIDADDLDDVLEDHFTILENEIRNLAAGILRERKKIPNGTYLAPAENMAWKPGRELDLVERLLYMRQGGTFQQSNMDALIQLARQLEEHRTEAGTTLWKVGQPSGFMYMILTGSVRCTMQDGTYFRAGPGYPLGNLESQCGALRWYEAVTEAPVVAMRGHTSTFTDLLEDHFAMAREFLAGMAKGLIRILNEQRQAKAQAESEQVRAASA